MGESPFVLPSENNIEGGCEVSEAELTQWSKQLWELWRAELLCDVELRAGGHAVRAHRVVLAGRSPYFRAMFASALAERRDVVTIGEVEGPALRQLVCYLYGGHAALCPADAPALLHAAALLQVDGLARACCRYIAKRLRPDTCLAAAHFADCHGLSGLRQAAESVALQNFLQASRSEDFLKLTLNQLARLVGAPGIVVTRESQVVAAVLRWVQAEPDHRTPDLAGLLSRCHLAHLSPSHLAHLRIHPLVRSDLSCRDLLDRILAWQLWLAKPIAPLPQFYPQFRPRKAYAGLLICAGGRNKDQPSLSEAECYDWLNDRWESAPSMVEQRRHVGCTTLNGKVYVAGGCGEKGHLASAEVFDPKVYSWQLLANMAVPRRGVGLCGVAEGPVLYAAGGLGESGVYAGMERYDVGADHWSSVTPPDTGCWGGALVACGGSLYMCGGESGSGALRDCRRYDPLLDRWASRAHMAVHRAGAAAVALEGLIYVFGGFDQSVPLASVERYDPFQDSWQAVQPMSVARGGVAAAALGGFILVAGGHDSSQYLATVEAYEPHYDRWSKVSALSVPRAGAGLAWLPPLSASSKGGDTEEEEEDIATPA